jgi:hypothetical protein
MPMNHRTIQDRIHSSDVRPTHLLLIAIVRREGARELGPELKRLAHRLRKAAAMRARDSAQHIR